MKRSPSPLRYPGGKASIFGMTRDIVFEYNLMSCQYAEPYAGGCGLALSLLFEGYVSELFLNDIDPSVAYLWDAILNSPDELCKRIDSAILDIDEWKKQKLIQKFKAQANPLDLAFSTLYLNRTNRSGIIKAGVIGGQKQNGNYKMDCRFNKESLISKIESIAKRKDSINIYNLDAIEFIEHLEGLELSKPLLMVDPPYYSKGKTLYTNFYNHEDHVDISKKLANTYLPWLLTYDNTPEIQKLYTQFSQYQFQINYSAAKKRVGTELFITSDYFAHISHKRLQSA